MRNRIVIALLVLLVGYFAFYILFYTAFLNIPIMKTPSVTAFIQDESFLAVKKPFPEQETLLSRFVMNHFVSDSGAVYSTPPAISKEPVVLSESIGLLMDYAILKGDKELFYKELDYLKEKMLTENHLVRWKVSKGAAGCNAAIDDLRIIRTLLEAYNLWQDEDCLNMAGVMQESLYRLQVNQGDFFEFYDWKTDKAMNRSPLCYFDLYTIDRISVFNEGWGEVANRGLDIIKNGRYSDTSPFFYKYYDYIKGEYFPDEEYSKSRGICLTYTLYTVLHLAEVNEDTGFFTEWLKEQNEKGRIYGWYNPNTGEPSNQMESTAVYALAAIYADKVGEKELSRDLIEKMLQFMITNEKSPFLGGYGDENTRSFYSFDNLTALWALSTANR
ncbi:MAG: glycoside hydrolase [Clostridia bacterium]|nr:glycoside hydrolase [Clostridia bacterium]